MNLITQTKNMKTKIKLLFSVRGIKFTANGFILPLTLLVCLIILMISAGISMILSKEIYFSRVSRESQLAYYAADDAMSCVLMIEGKYVDPDTGLGIFPYDGLSSNTTVDMQNVLNKINTDRTSRGFSALNLTDIKCAMSPIFDANAATSAFSAVAKTRVNSSGVTENGQISSFNMKMDLGGDLRCATVTVFKTDKFRQIIARGFSTCGYSTTNLIERAVISTTEVK